MYVVATVLKAETGFSGYVIIAKNIGKALLVGAEHGCCEVPRAVHTSCARIVRESYRPCCAEELSGHECVDIDARMHVRISFANF